jgi:hypothetical protein
MKEDIIRMAREAGLGFLFEDHLLVYGELERFAALVAAAEREAILQMSATTWCKTQADYDAAIRARGQDPMPLFDDWDKDWTK